jgi:hypothetical protein
LRASRRVASPTMSSIRERSDACVPHKGNGVSNGG